MDALTVLTIGFEGHTAHAVRQGFGFFQDQYPGLIRRLTVERSRLRSAEARMEVAEKIRAADVVIVNGVHDRDDAAALRKTLEAAPPEACISVMPNAAELRTFAWLGGDRPASGVRAPTSPLGSVTACFRDLTAGNVARALAWIVHTLRPSLLPTTPGVPEPVAHRGYWHPSCGVHDTWAEHISAREAFPDRAAGRVLLTCFPTQITTGNDRHLRALVAALEQRGVAVIGWLGTIDAIPDLPEVDLVLNATGFTLTGSHGQANIDGDVAFLAAADIPHLGAVPLFHQTVQEWDASPVGLTPVQTAMQLAIPELEGAAAPIVIAGRDAETDELQPILPNIHRLAELAANTVRLRRMPAVQKRLAFVIFGFPPAGGTVGSAAHLDVWASLHRILQRLHSEGYGIAVPATPEALLDLVLTSAGGGARSDAAVADRYPIPSYLAHAGEQARRIARGWGPPPGDVDTDGRNLLVHGVTLGNVFIGVQPSFGYDDDPMALLFQPEATPSHSFAGFYSWLRREFRPDAMIHVGTHGSLEFMPGKQTALAPTDWPGLLGDSLPHYYLYCVNDPSEGSIAKRRSNATLISHLTPPLDHAGLYGELTTLAEEIRHTRTARAAGEDVQARLAAVASAAEQAHLSLSAQTDPDAALAALQREVEEISATLIPIGLHVLGTGIPADEARVTLHAAAGHARPDRGLPALVDELEAQHTAGTPLADLPPDDAGRIAAETELDAVLAAALSGGPVPPTALPAALVDGWLAFLRRLRRDLDDNDELGALLHALDGGYVRPGPGGEPSRYEAVLPTGRNMHALDPQRVPTPAARVRGRALADALVEAARDRTGALPETVALVLWGVDNVKNGGEAIAQLLALIGVEPLPDPSGRVERFRLIPLGELGRPRIDVVATMSGIFRDLFPTTITLLDRAIRAVAEADEPDELNYLRAHARVQAAALGLTTVAAATRLWSAAPGQYGAGVNHVVQASQWDEEADLADVFTRRMGHAWGAGLEGAEQEQLLRRSLSTATVTFQNVDSAETSLGDVDHYFEYLGGLTAAVARETGHRPEALVADSYAARPRVRTL